MKPSERGPMALPARAPNKAQGFSLEDTFAAKGLHRDPRASQKKTGLGTRRHLDETRLPLP